MVNPGSIPIPRQFIAGSNLALAHFYQCGDFDCLAPSVDKKAAELGVRPEPNPATEKEKHKEWLQDYPKWKNPNCKCGKGYWCRAHGIWVSGSEVSEGLASAKDAPVQRCPDSHFTQQSAMSFGESGAVPALGEGEGMPVRSEDSFAQEFPTFSQPSNKGKAKAPALSMAATGESHELYSEAESLRGSSTSYSEYTSSGDFGAAEAYPEGGTPSSVEYQAETSQASARRPAQQGRRRESRHQHRARKKEEDSGWRTVQDDSGNPYYYNILTGESSWEMPT